MISLSPFPIRLLFGAALLADDSSPVMASTHAWVAASASIRDRLLFGAALLAAGFIPVMASTHGAAASQLITTFEAKAYQLDTGSPAYNETHEYISRDGAPVKARVTYSLPDGTPLAAKQLDFSDSLTAPYFDRVNKRSGYREAFVDDQDHFGLLVAQKAEGKKACEKGFTNAPALIVDAGFNQYLRAHLEPLANGKELEFDLALAKACRTISFEARATSVNEDQIWIEMQPSSGFLRMLVPDTLVLYNRNTGDIMEYRGLSDLNDEDGRNMRVRIVFEPPQTRPLDQTVAEQK